MPQSVFEDIDPEVNALLAGEETCEYYTLNEYIQNFSEISLTDSLNFHLVNYNIRSYHSNHSSFEAILKILPTFHFFLCAQTKK